MDNCWLLHARKIADVICHLGNLCVQKSVQMKLVLNVVDNILAVCIVWCTTP